MSNWKKNKELAVTWNKDPTMTDQAAARETDINVIVKTFTITGQAKGGPLPGIYGDFTDLPSDLRGMIETARKLRDHMKKLPKQLQNLGPQQLLALTPTQLADILKPQAPPAPTQEQK